MNDRFLFKGKRTNWQELPKEQWWVEGDVSHHKTGKVFIKERFGSALASYEIEPYTLSQYIGQNDIHNNKMWENDIVKETYSNGESIVCPIIYSKNYAGFMVQDDGGCLYHIDSEIDKFEVIGNVFDNPEIFKKKPILGEIGLAIKEGLINGTVQLKDRYESGEPSLIYAQIGDSFFYYEDEYDIAGVSLAEYCENFTIDEIASFIEEALKDEESAKNFCISPNTYHYYMEMLGLEEEKDYE